MDILNIYSVILAIFFGTNLANVTAQGENTGDRIFPFTTPAPNPNSNSSDKNVLIRVAMLVAENDRDYGLTRSNSMLRNSGGAIPMALDRLWAEKALPQNVNFTFSWRYEKCKVSRALGLAYKFINELKADVIIATSCMDVPPVLGYLTANYNLPMIVWGQSMDSSLTNSKSYPTTLNAVPNFGNMARALCDMLEYFNWTQFAVVVQSDMNGVSGGCYQFAQDIDAEINRKPGMQMNFKTRMYNVDTGDPNAIIAQLKLRARIIVVCFDDIRQYRTFALKLFDSGLNTSDYVYIIPDADLTYSLYLPKLPFWVQKRGSENASFVYDGRDADAEVIGRLSYWFYIDITTSNLSDQYMFNISNPNSWYQQVVDRTRQWPFYCPASECGPVVLSNMSIYAPLLFDAIYNYGLALASSFNQSNGQILPEIYRNGTLLAQNSERTFQGMTGTVSVGSDGKRRSVYVFADRRQKVNGDTLRPRVKFQLIQNRDTNISVINMTNAWVYRGNRTPVAVPKCGFDGQSCSIAVFDLYKGYFISGIVLFVAIFLISFWLIAYLIYAKIRDRKKNDLLWQIPYSSLSNIKQSKNSTTERSERSLLSGPSTTSRSTTSKFTEDSLAHSRRFKLYLFNNDEKCIVIAHCPYSALTSGFTEAEMAELRAMRMTDHPNLNRFFGLSFDGPDVLSVWKFCVRGSLRDVVSGDSNFTRDIVFLNSVLWELCEGLHFLHNSQLQYHGQLKSAHCLIDERWQVKISYFGLRRLQAMKKLDTDDLLWKAPEQLRMAEHQQHSSIEGSKQADIYSLALVFTEVLNMRPCWVDEAEINEPHFEHRSRRRNTNHQRGGEERNPMRGRNTEEIVYLVKRGGLTPLRPTLKPAIEGSNPALIHLIRECWSEKPTERPSIDLVRNTLRSIRDSGNANLMDHVFNMLEQYATKLEEEVEERTKELVEEKKKSDILLYRMLPKQIADRLRQGQTVEPEHFDCVTVLFSDIVGFTALSNKMRPLQVVNLVNDLYSILDSVIDEHDVYKVESVGDGYLCVSGLPKRNGNLHAKECADTALKFLQSMQNFEITALPDENIRLRIGLHSGPCVAGVVGLSMPRYCLFGDTVNTASRMESSSNPNKIQSSNDTQRFLSENFEGYVLESRGEVIIKGKGVMQTFWLIARNANQQQQQEI